ncbi:MAG: hypothetical protein ACD_58C00283G0002 [uncultured bacterium]|nr:MAG: hypothetical protein ACD_58C00283G0002 [uncultured bacterium]
MSIAVIKTGGKQYKVQENDIIKVEKLDNSEAEKLEFDDILGGKKVIATILSNEKSKKVRVVKFKNKTGYHRVYGHRQPVTKIKIEKIHAQ